MSRKVESKFGNIMNDSPVFTTVRKISFVVEMGTLSNARIIYINTRQIFVY